MTLEEEIRLNELMRIFEGNGAIPLDDPVFGPDGTMQFNPPSSANDDAYLKLTRNSVPTPSQIYDRQKIIEWNRELDKIKRPDLKTPAPPLKPMLGLLGALRVEGTRFI